MIKCRSSGGQERFALALLAQRVRQLRLVRAVGLVPCCHALDDAQDHVERYKL